MSLLEHKAELLTPQAGHLVLGVTADGFALVGDLAVCNTVHAAEGIEQRGLSGPGGSHDHGKVVLEDVNINPIKDCCRHATL